MCAQLACLHFPFFFVRIFSPVVFIFNSLKDLHYGIERSLFSYRVGSCDGSNLEYSNLAAMIEDYFEGCVEPMEVASAGVGEDHIEPAQAGLSKLGELTLCSVIMYVMCK